MNQIDYSIIGQRQPVTTLGEHIGQALDIAGKMESRTQQRELYKRQKAAYDKKLTDEQRLTKAYDAGYDPNTGRVDMAKVAPVLFKSFTPDVAYKHLQESMKYNDELENNERQALAQQGVDQYSKDMQAYGALEAQPRTEVTPEQFDANYALRNKMADQTPQERLQNYGLIEGAAYNPGAEKLVAQTNLEAKVPDAFGKTPTGLDLKYATDPEYVQAQMDILKSYYTNGKINEASYNALSGVVRTRPVSWQSQIPQFLLAKETNQNLDNSKTLSEIEKLRLEREKAEREEAAATKKAKEAESNAEQYTNNTLSKIDALVSDIGAGRTRTGMTANAWATYITSSKAATQKALFEQIKNALTIQKLLDVKAQGGTFGALSEKELQLLERSASNLDFAGSKDRNIAALNEIKNTIEAARRRKSGGSVGTDGAVDLNNFWK